MKNVKYIGLMGLAAVIFIVAAYAPQASAVAGNDTANVDIGIVADMVNLNVTATTTEGGEMHIFVNGVEVQKTTVVNYYDHNYDGAITYLTQSIGGVQYNLVAFANYTDGKLSVLLVNDKIIAGWVGVLNSTDPVGQRIYAGNSSVVLELNRLDSSDSIMLRLLDELLAETGLADSQLRESDRAIEDRLMAQLRVQNVTIHSMLVEDVGLRARVSELEDGLFRLAVVFVGAFVAAALIAFSYWARVEGRSLNSLDE